MPWRSDFRRIDPTQARVILLEGSNRVLPPYAPDLSEKARKQLVALGVDVRTGKVVTSIDSDGVNIGDERIETHTVLWAAGVTGSRFGRALGVPLDRAGRVIVNPDLTIPGHPEVYVVGDLASLVVDGVPVPGVAPAAMQEARHAANNLLRALRHEPGLPFRYHEQGLARHDRPLGGRRSAGQDQALGPDRVAGLALHPHHVLDRVPQPRPRRLPVGLVVPLLRPRGPADHGAHLPRARPGPRRTAGRAFFVGDRDGRPLSTDLAEGNPS